MNGPLISFKIVPLAINTLIPVSFLLVETLLKLLFSYIVQSCPHISFNGLHINLTLKINFQFSKQESFTELGPMNMVGEELAQSCILP